MCIGGIFGVSCKTPGKQDNRSGEYPKVPMRFLGMVLLHDLHDLLGGTDAEAEGPDEPRLHQPLFPSRGLPSPRRIPQRRSPDDTVSNRDLSSATGQEVMP